MTSQRTKQLFAAPFVVFLLMLVVFPLILLFVNAFINNGKFSFAHFGEFFSDPIYIKTLLRSLWIALVATLFCILIGYPVAYILAQTKFKKAPVILMLFILPMWINTLLRTYATKQVLVDVFGIEPGYGMLLFGLVMDFLPFMIMPIYVVLTNIDKKLIEASRDLGAPPVKTFLKTILPLSVPGIISGTLMCFTPMVSTYFLSDYLGGGKTPMFGEFFEELYELRRFGLGSVLALVLLVIIGLCVFATNRLTKIGNKRGGLW